MDAVWTNPLSHAVCAMQKILVTGAAGFIGFHLSRRLLDMGKEVVGLDNFNPYYDITLKEQRVKLLSDYDNFSLVNLGLESPSIQEVFAREHFEAVYHLAAQDGARFSLEKPMSYVTSNMLGFAQILEGCRHHQVKHLLYASSCNVYGANRSIPFSADQNVDHPLTLYAATKKSNELMAHSYSHLFHLPSTGLRFFTVYGPWGRPDMALFLFTRAMLEGKAIKVFNRGHMKRDFTYIDDIVESLVRLINVVPGADPNWDPKDPNPATSSAPFRIYNIGSSKSVGLLDMIATLESALGVKAQKDLLPMQPGEVVETHADVSDLIEAINFKPNTSLEYGIGEFVKWYRDYYQL